MNHCSPLMTLQAFCPKHSSLGIYHIPHWNTFVFVCAHCPVLLNNSWTVMVKTYLFSHKCAWGGYREKKGAHKKRARNKLTTSLKLFSVVRRYTTSEKIYNVDYLIGQCSVDHTQFICLDSLSLYIQRARMQGPVSGENWKGLSFRSRKPWSAFWNWAFGLYLWNFT